MASHLRGASLVDVRFSVKAYETAARGPGQQPIDIVEYYLHWIAFNRAPEGTYTAGRIDTFDSTSCAGTSSAFSGDWMEDHYWQAGGSPAATWATMTFAQKQYWCEYQNLSWDGGVKYSPWDWVALTDEWALRPGDVAVLRNSPAFPDELGEAYHYIVVHRVGLQSGIWYATSNKEASDELGYYEELHPASGLIGCFRYNGSRPTGGALGGYVRHASYTTAPEPTRETYPPGLYMEHGTIPSTQTYWYGGEWITVTAEIGNTKLIVPMTGGSLAAELRFTTERDHEGHGIAKSYVNGELMKTLETNWVVPVASMVSTLLISGRHPWETMRIGNVTSVVWPCDGGGELPDRRRETITSWSRRQPWVLSDDSLTPNSTPIVTRNWSNWLNYFAANPLHPENYSGGSDLFGAVNNPVPIDRIGHGVPNAIEWCNGVAVDDDGYIYCNAGAEDDLRFYDYLGFFDLFFYAICRGNTVSAVTDRSYRTKLAWVGGGGSQILYRLIEHATARSTYGEIVTVHTGEDCRHPSLAAYEDGVVTCWYMAADTQAAKLSSDDGRTWSELTDMMGSSLRNVSVCQHHGITLGVGVLNSQLYFVRSNDQGRTQDAQPNGESQQLIGACGSDCRPSITWYPDGEVAVWAEDADGEQITYHNTSSGYATWTVVP